MMTLSRRNFVKASTLAMAGIAVFRQPLCAEARPATRLGLQLYTVRDAMKVNPADTLKQLGVMGYHVVEHANYINRKFYGYSAADFKHLLDNCGLKMISGHTVMTEQHWDVAKNDFTDAWKYTIDDAVTVGQKYVINPSLSEKLRNDTDGLKRLMDQFNKCGELCQKNGLKFGYHNHDFEISTLVEGIKLYDFILQKTDPKLVVQQMDIGNMYGLPGGNAIDFIKKYPGRFELMHVKDEIKISTKAEMGTGYESTLLGKGVMPLKQILDAGKSIGGTTQFIIEQESYQGLDVLDCCKADLAAMIKLGFK